MDINLIHALEAAGPWLTVAAVAIVLLGVTFKVLVLDHSLVPFALLEQERGRSDKIIDGLDRVVGALDRLTVESSQAMAASTQVAPLVQTIRDELRELRRDVEDLRREARRP